MDLNDIWQENKRFITTVGSGFLVFLIGFLVVEGMYSGDIDSIRRKNSAARGKLRAEMFTADDLKNMNPEQMGASMGGRSGRKSRAEWRDELVDFYSRYGLDDKIAGVDAALDKWNGRESRMFDTLYKKYDVEIRAKSDAAAKDEV